MWFSTVRRSCVHRLAVCVCVCVRTARPYIYVVVYVCVCLYVCMCLCGMSVFICRSAKCMMIFQLVIFIFAFRQRLWQYIIATTESQATTRQVQQQQQQQGTRTTATSHFAIIGYMRKVLASLLGCSCGSRNCVCHRSFLRLLSCFPASSARCCCLSLFCTKIEKATIKNLFFRWTNIAAATVAAATSCHKVFN